MRPVHHDHPQTADRAKVMLAPIVTPPAAHACKLSTCIAAYTAGLQWYWARTRDKASHDPMPIPLGYRGHLTIIEDVFGDAQDMMGRRLHPENVDDLALQLEQMW
ncbi:hypothetical protein TNCV_742431 [Trichonephila clavipes]|nr:hypothetical protein TNCV_742431 [Trichonephila clavipes]